MAFEIVHTEAELNIHSIQEYMNIRNRGKLGRFQTDVPVLLVDIFDLYYCTDFCFHLETWRNANGKYVPVRKFMEKNE